MRIVVEPSCLVGLVTSSIEVYPNETTGLLAGRLARRLIRGRPMKCLVLSAAQPVQTAKRTRNGVDPKGNQAAYTRVRSSINALGYQLVGGYHSHPNFHSRLSKSDLAWCKEEVEELRQLELFPRADHYWLEVVVKIDKQSYVRHQLRQASLWESAVAIGGLVKINTETGYHITLRGHYLDTRTFRALPFRLSFSRN